MVKKIRGIDGQRMVLTGTLTDMNREMFKAIVKASGGVLAATMDGKVHFLIEAGKASNCKGEESKKYIAAKELGIDVMTEGEFFDKFELYDDGQDVEPVPRKKQGTMGSENAPKKKRSSKPKKDDDDEEEDEDDDSYAPNKKTTKKKAGGSTEVNAKKAKKI